MGTPNKNGVYEAELTEELARRGRAYASVEIAQCQDGLYRYGKGVMYSYGGSGSPITNNGDGYSTPAAAKQAAIEEMLERFPRAFPSDPQSVHDELKDLRTMIEDKQRQPSLFG